MRKPEDDYRFIEIEDGLFIDADATVQYDNVKDGHMGYRALHTFLPDKKIITVTNGELIALGGTFRVLKNKYDINKMVDEKEEIKEEAEMRLADAIPEREEYEAQLINDEEKLIIP